MFHHHHQRASFCSDKKQQAAWQTQGVSILVLILLGTICVQGYRWYWEAQAQRGAGMLYTPLEPRFLGRNYKIRLLEQQVLDRDNEIKYLQYQLDKAQLAAQLKATNIQAAEALIKALQERGDTEKLERTKAQLSLAEKSSALSACNAQREGLQADVERCGADVLALTHRRTAGQTIGSANGAQTPSDDIHPPKIRSAAPKRG